MPSTSKICPLHVPKVQNPPNFFPGPLNQPEQKHFPIKTKARARHQPQRPTYKINPRDSQILPQTSSQHPPKSFPRSTQNRSRRPLGAHLGPMLEKSSTLNAKKRPRGGQERSEGAQDHPKPFPNEAQDPPKSTFRGLFLAIPNLR